MRAKGNKSRLLRGHRRRHVRRGAAVVEMAVVTPLLLTMLFGIMEFGWAFMVHETMTNATREACRLASLQGTTDAEIVERFVGAMNGTGIAAGADMIAIDHATTEDPVVTITAVVPYEQVSVTGLTSFLGIGRETLNATCSMRKEGI